MVDASSVKGSQLKDDRNKNRTRFMKMPAGSAEAGRGPQRGQANTGSDEVADLNKKQRLKQRAIKDPLLSHTICRGAIYEPSNSCLYVWVEEMLQFPSYVNRKGYVINAIVKPQGSSSDVCLQEYAIRRQNLPDLPPLLLLRASTGRLYTGL